MQLKYCTLQAAFDVGGYGEMQHSSHNGIVACSEEHHYLDCSCCTKYVYNSRDVTTKCCFLHFKKGGHLEYMAVAGKRVMLEDDCMELIYM